MFYEKLVITLQAMRMEKVRDRLKTTCVQSDDSQKMYKLQKTIIHKIDSYESFNCVAFRNQTLTFETPNYLGMFVLEVSNLLYY